MFRHFILFLFIILPLHAYSAKCPPLFKFPGSKVFSIRELTDWIKTQSPLPSKPWKTTTEQVSITIGFADTAFTWASVTGPNGETGYRDAQGLIWMAPNLDALKIRQHPEGLSTVRINPNEVMAYCAAQGGRIPTPDELLRFTFMLEGKRVTGTNLWGTSPASAINNALADTGSQPISAGTQNLVGLFQPLDALIALEEFTGAMRESAYLLGMDMSTGRIAMLDLDNGSVLELPGTERIRSADITWRNANQYLYYPLCVAL